jgi:hypothetical protein
MEGEMAGISANSVEYYQTRVGDRSAEISGSDMSHKEAAEKAYSEATGVASWEDAYILERVGDWRVYGVKKLDGKVERVAVLHVKSEAMS